MDERERAAQIELATGGDAEALQRLIVDYHAPLRRSVESALDGVFSAHIEPDDILQEAYISAFKAVTRSTFDGPASFYKWLETIAGNQLKNRVRALKQQKRDIGREMPAPSRFTTTHADLFQRLASPQITPSRGVAKEEAAAAVMSCLARLTDDQRIAITMRFLENRPVADILEKLGKSEPAVHMLFHRGLKALREHMVSITNYMTRS